MRAVLTGQVGLDKQEYLRGVERITRDSRSGLAAFHVGDRMYADAPDVPPGRILDLPLSRLHTLRRSVFKDILREAEGRPNIIVNTHATFRWRHSLFRAFDFDQIERLRPDMFICLVDSVDAVHHRLMCKHKVDATLKDTLVWREEEILATELLALALGCANSCYVLPRGKTGGTMRTCFRLITQPHLPKAYVSYPMTHVVGMPEVIAEIDAFRLELADRLIVFDPVDVDEKHLVDAAIAATKEGRDFVESQMSGPDGATQNYQVSAKQLLELAGDIDGQIYARDFQLIDQSDMIISLVPELPDGTPAISSGVERELHHAYEHGRQVYVVWKPERPPSPFITETASRLFRTTTQVLAFLDDARQAKDGAARAAV